MMIGSVAELCRDQGVELVTTEAFRERLVDQGFSLRYGARPLRRAVQSLLEDVLAEALLSSFAREGATLIVDAGGDGCVVLSNGAETMEVAVEAPGGIEGEDAAFAPRSDNGSRNAGGAEDESQSGMEFLAQAMMK